MNSRACPVCQAPLLPAFRHQVLFRYEAEYCHCEECGLLHIPNPFWLAEAYSARISGLDTWNVSRNWFNRQRLLPILWLLFPTNSTFVDVGCGYGLLVRLMRDAGLNFYGTDQYCENIFAKPFIAPSGSRAAVVTAFEVLEHLQEPAKFLKEQFDAFGADTLIASTGVFEGERPPLSWDYYSFETGQHISLYQPRTLARLAGTVGGRYFRLAADLHLITRADLPLWKVRLLQHGRIRRLLSIIAERRLQRLSLTVPDHRRLLALASETSSVPTDNPPKS